MKTSITPESLTVCLEGKLDSVNARETEEEILALIDAHPDRNLCLDAEALSYISSSGLRVMMALQKRLGDRLSVRSVSPEVYHIFAVTGFTALIDVRRKMREISVAGCPLIGKGAYGSVYRLDSDTVVKVYPGSEAYYPMIRREQQLARQAFLLGVPTAIPFDVVKVEDRYGAVFEMVDAHSCNDILRDEPWRRDEIIGRYAAFLKSLHSLTDPKRFLPDARDRCLKRVDDVSAFLPPGAADRIRALVRAMPEDNHLVHGDVHLNNVMVTGDSLMLIDMDSLCVGDPVFEFAALFMSYIAFVEDDPEDIVIFHGITAETGSAVLYRSLAACLGQPDGNVPEAVMRKISLLGYLRFLEVLTVEMADVHTELKDLQVRHASEHIAELIRQVDSLTLAQDMVCAD